MTERLLFEIGLGLVLVGFALAIGAALVMALRATRGAVRGGGAVLVGPFPIVFGTDKESLRDILLIALALVIVMLAVTLLPSFSRGTPS